MDKKVLSVNSEWPLKSLTECLINGNKALAKKVDRAYEELVDQFSANTEDKSEAAENYAIIAEDLGVEIAVEGTEEEVQDSPESQEEDVEVAGDIEVTRMNKVDIGSIKAFCDVAYSGLVIKGFRVVENEEGTFVGFPSRENQGEWFPTTYTKNSKLKEAIELSVKEAYSK